MAPPSTEAQLLVRNAIEAQFGATPNLNDPKWQAIVDEVDNQLQNGTPTNQITQAVKDIAPSILAPNGRPVTFGGAAGRIDPSSGPPVGPAYGGGYVGQYRPADAPYGYSTSDLENTFNRPDGGSLLTPPDGNGIRYAVNNKGEVISAFRQVADGSWVSVTEDPAGSGSGGSASAAASLAEAQRQFDATFGEDIRQFDQSFGEDQRQFDASLGQRQLETNLSEGRLNRKDVGDLGLGLGRLNLDQQEYIAEILRNPADFLARAFSQRGGQSPFPEISQADLINRLSSEFDRIRDFTGQQLAGNSRLLAGTPGAPVAPRATGRILPPGSAPFYGPVGGNFYSSGNEALDQQLTDVNQNPLDNSRTFTPTAGAPDVTDITGGRTNLTGAAAALAQLGQTARAEKAAGRFEDGTQGKARNRLSLVGEGGPELQVNHGDGSFDIVDAPTTRILIDHGLNVEGMRGGTGDRVRGYVGGTLDGLTADDLGRLSLFDVAAVAPTSNAQIEQYAQLTTPPGPSNLLGGSRIPDLNVSGNDPSAQLFSPQEFAKLTPDEQVAVRTRLASKNKSLDDYLHASSRFFGGTPRTQSRARIDVTR